MKSLNPRVMQSLDRAYERAERRTEQIEKLRLVIFSDHHRGQKDPADDFWRCQEAYHAALTTYDREGWEFFLLGDVEELWECSPEPALAAYAADTLALERPLFAAGLATRFFGNHDMQWEDRAEAQRLLSPFIGASSIIESLRMEVREGETRLGEIFFTHGHQGDCFSDQYAWLSKPFVRLFFAWFQRLTWIPSSMPSKNRRARAKHEKAMHAWASGRSNLVLVAGHTHHPVFSSISHGEKIESRYKPLIAAAPDEASRARLVKERDAAIEKAGGMIKLKGKKPAYFNSGCCCFGDGDITAIEIEGGEIRLVRWGGGNHARARAVLEYTSLARVFERL